MKSDPREIRTRLRWFVTTKNKTKNISKTCRFFGISRPSYYLWLRRYQELGKRGLVAHSRRPQASPSATPIGIVKTIYILRRRNGWGPGRIKKALSKKMNFNISTKTIYIILKKKKLNKLR